MIELPNASATRLALKIASWSEPPLGSVMLAPDGMLFATNGIALIASRNAHDAEVVSPLFVTPPKRTPFAHNAESFALDVERGVLIERRARSEAEHEVQVETGLKYPNVYNALPHHLSVPAGETPPFDSIIAGRIASEYGLKRGVWAKGRQENRVYLTGVEETDTVILAGIRSDT